MRIVTLATIFCLAAYLKAISNDGYIRISTVKDTVDSFTIAPEIYGSFLEVIYDAYLGPHGFCAQELLNRGFDHLKKDDGNSASFWEKGEGERGFAHLKEGGYNEGGSYSMLLKKD